MPELPAEIAQAKAALAEPDPAIAPSLPRASPTSCRSSGVTAVFCARGYAAAPRRGAGGCATNRAG